MDLNYSITLSSGIMSFFQNFRNSRTNLNTKRSNVWKSLSFARSEITSIVVPQSTFVFASTKINYTFLKKGRINYGTNLRVLSLFKERGNKPLICVNDFAIVEEPNYG